MTFGGCLSLYLSQDVYHFSGELPPLRRRWAAPLIGNVGPAPNRTQPDGIVLRRLAGRPRPPIDLTRGSDPFVLNEGR